MKLSGNLPVVKTTTQPTATLHEMVWKLKWLKQPTATESLHEPTTTQPTARNLYMKWSGNLPVVKTTTQPTATESLHEMVWKPTTTQPTATESLHEMVWKLTSG